MCNEHNLTLEVEFDEEVNLVTLNIYGKSDIIYDEQKRYKMFWTRLKTALKVLFGIEVTWSFWFYFRGRNHIEDFCTAIIEGTNKVKFWEDEQK